MSEKKYITNTFQKGLYMDATYNAQPVGSYKYAFNAVNRDFESLNELSNEHSDRLCVEFANPIVGIGYIDERDRFVIFTKDGLFLVNVNDCSQEFIADDDEFNCNWNLDTDKWITPQFKTIDPCAETFVYWSSGCEYYKINIDEMLSPERKNALKESMKPIRNQCSDITCEYFKVFKLSCQPRLSPVAYKTGGGGLLAGAYQFSVRLVNNEGTPTNWFTVTDPVYIGGEHNEAGEVTNGYIDINMSALDCNFDYGELAVISTIGGIPTAKLIGRFNYVNGRYNYTYMGPEGDPIAIDEIITKGKTYLQGQDMIQYNGNMLYFNIRQEKNLNYQRQANEITVNWNKYRIPYNIVKKYNLKTYMRGESYHFGIKWNSSDGRSSRVFHIPAMGATGGGNNSSTISATEVQSSDAVVIPTGQGQYKRDRSPNPDTVRDPQFDQFDTNVQAQAESIETEITDIEQALNDCEDCPPAADAAAVDIPKIDEIGADVGALLGDYGVDELNVDYSASTIKGSITNLFDSVKNRERTEYIPRTVVIDKGAFIGMPSGSEDSSDSSFFSGLMFDTNGKTEIEFPVYRESLGRTIVDFEEDILYPDQKDCTGEYIYGDLANTRVRKHQVPWTSQVQHFVSNSRGVPSEATPDADEYQDAYIDLIGPAFGNIIFPTEEELGFKLCENNPYTICQVERTSKNKTIHSKGILTNTLESSNDGKSYLYPAHGLNSQDSTVNRYINIDGSRLDAGATFGNNFNFWSLDSMVKAHALNVSHVRLEGLMSGIGNRHGLYATGEEPADSMYGSRIDQRGTRQAINLHKFVKMNENMPLVPLDYKTYAAANEVISPPLGATTPLMNKYQQESVWLGANLEGFILTDKSFKGDVMDHSAPITYAGAFYAALVRNLPNQYGDLTNMPYKPILEAGQVHKENIEGLCGDTFIGPHSFVRTSYVSDKVGNYFPITNMVPGKAERCVCDSPEDVIHSLSGKWIPSTLPIENDYADAKNWAGLHTDTISHSSADVQQRAPISDYYYPKTLTTLITYWGEFEVNPHMRQRGDTLDEQVYKPLKAEFGLDSSIDSSTGTGWKDDFLNQFHWVVEQPSQWKILKKTLIKTILAILAPVFGLDYILDGSSTPEFIESLGLGAIVIGVWLMMLKVLFSNKKIDELFGIPQCLTDDEGGDKDLHIANFFQNFNKANSDFSLQNKIEVFYGIPVPYYTCDCDDCDLKTTDEIYISDEQQQGSQLDAYGVIRPHNKVNIPSSFGKLTDLFIESANLYAHTTDQIIPLQYGRVAQPSSIGEIILGAGSIIAKPIGMAEGTFEGFAGLMSRQHAINTQYGRFFIDYKAKKLYQFRNGIKELSNIGVYSHFRNKLWYQEDGDVPNEHINPNDLALGIDPRLERLLLTKRAVNPEQSWTMSFDILQQHWVSFHEYIPHFYAWDRAHMISSDGTGLYIHDVRNNFQTYRGKYSPYVLEFVINDADIINEIFSGALLETFAVASGGEGEYNLLDRYVTFNKVWMRNNYQSSGYLDFYPITTLNGENENTENKISDNPHININKVNGHWRYHQMYDLASNRNVPLYELNDPYGVHISPINVNPVIGEKDTTSFKNNIHLNNYLTVRLVFDNFDEYKLYTRSHTILIKKDREFYG
jgi:hypothetical protein